MSFIEIKDIRKDYDGIEAIKEICLDIEKGELFGFIGPDGAGKTSLFRIIATLLLPSGGRVRVGDFDVVKDYRQIRNITGYMPGTFSLYPDLTIEENLRFFASIFNTSIDENYHLIKDIYRQIEPFKKRRAGRLSGGMKQKLALSCALIHKPELLILDEPTTGVDAVSRRELWDMLKKLKESGITIIVSTPYMDEAELCDRIALIKDGSVLACRKPAEIPSLFAKRLFAVYHHDKYKMIKLLRNYPGKPSVFPFGDSIHFSTRDNDAKEDIENFLIENNLKNFRLEEIQPGIEDVFIDRAMKQDAENGRKNGK